MECFTCMHATGISFLFNLFSSSRSIKLFTRTKNLCTVLAQWFLNPHHSIIFLFHKSKLNTRCCTSDPCKLSFITTMMKPTVAVDAEYLRQIEKARSELRALISSKNCAPLMLGLAWHDAGTYDAVTRTGGPNGSIKNEVELNPAYKELKTAVGFCEEVKKKCPKITYADLYQLAGVVAVEVTRGPTIDFVPGRKDSLETPTQGRLPDAHKGAQHLREVFHRMGLSDKDIVALSGGYTLGEAQGSGFRGPWTRDPSKFDNSYFVELLLSEKPVSSGNQRVRLPADNALVEDPKFRKYVELYAKDEDAFFKDYAASHKKFSELGFKHNHFGDHRVMHVIIGLVIASTVAILGYLIQVNRRSKRGNY